MSFFVITLKNKPNLLSGSLLVIKQDDTRQNGAQQSDTSKVTLRKLSLSEVSLRIVTVRMT